MVYGDRFEWESYIEMLAKKYPKCFFEVPQERLPLKKGIESGLAQDMGLTPTSSQLVTMGDSLNWYRSHIAYQYCLKAGTERVDLGGNRCEKVTAQEEREARKEIARINDELAARRNGEQIAVAKPRPPRLEDLMNENEAKLFERAEKALQRSKGLLVEDKELGKELAVAGLKIVAATVDELVGHLQKT